jgi:hypothetical protein
MKKLIVSAVLLLSVCFSVFASEWQSVIYDNQVNDISVVGNKVYTATNGGIEVFGKDGQKVFGENNLPWKIYTTVNSDLPRNFVNSLSADSSGDIFAMSNVRSWFVCKTNDYWNNIPVQEAEDIVIGSDGIRWAVLNINNRFGLYRDGGMGWEYISLSQEISGSINCIAVGGYGKGKDSVFCTIWGTRSGGIFRYDAMTATEKTWKLGNQLNSGSPLNIAVWGDTVIASGESGSYIFTPDTASSPWVLAYNDFMPKNNGGSVAYFKGHFYLGQRGGSLWCFNSGWQSLVFDPSSGWSGGGINCLATDGEKLYIGTNYHVWVYDGKTFSTLAITGLQYPHDNNILSIAPDNSGRVLVGTAIGGYCYDVNDNSPALNNSAQNVSGNIITSFTDKDGTLWIGRLGSFERITKDGKSEVYDGGTWHEAFNHPYWFVSSFGNVALVTSFDNRVYSYAGQGTWACKSDQPERLAGEKILSVSSTGKHLFIATDSSAYINDFSGIWLTEKLFYAPNRKVCGDESIGTNAWIFEPNVFYSTGGGDITLHGTCPWSNRVINDVKFSDYQFFVATDSGTYCVAASGKAIDVPINKLADKWVNTIYIDSASNSVWFGTAGGLTVWHRLSPTSAKPAFKSGIKNIPQKFSGQNVAYDIRGRKINNANHAAFVLNIVRLPNGMVKKEVTFNRYR